MSDTSYSFPIYSFFHRPETLWSSYSWQVEMSDGEKKKMDWGKKPVRHLITTTWQQTQTLKKGAIMETIVITPTNWSFPESPLIPCDKLCLNWITFNFSLLCWFRFSLFVILCRLQFSAAVTMSHVVLLKILICLPSCDSSFYYLLFSLHIVLGHLLTLTRSWQRLVKLFDSLVI